MSPAPRWPLMIVALSAVCVIAALLWATVNVVRLEDRERRAQANAAFEESVRLALWRLDSALTPLIAREAGRPYFQYQPFYAADRPYSAMLGEPRAGDVLVPSPLLQEPTPFVRLHFQRLSDGPLASPEVPTGNLRALADRAKVPGERIEAAQAELSRLAAMLGPSEFGRALRESAEPRGRAAGADELKKSNQPAPVPEDTATLSYREPARQSVDPIQVESLQQHEEFRQGLAAENEFNARKQAVQRGIAPEKNLTLEAGRPVLPPVPSVVGGAGRSPVTAGDKAKDQAPAQPSRDRTDAPAAGGTAPSSAPGAVSTASKPGRPEEDAKRARESAEKDEAEAMAALEDKAATDPALAELDYRFSKSDTGERGGKQSATGSPEGVTLTEMGSQAVVVVGELEPRWYFTQGSQPQLLLFRTVRSGDAALTQGCWLDWPVMHEWLVGGVRDLLPTLRIEPIPDAHASQPAPASSRRLAAIPAQINPGHPAALAVPGWTPMRTTLLLTWVSVLAALGGLASLVRTARDLAERRGRFVSAVTHELRTPLTTFVLYSQMLADGMVRDDAARGDYLATLKRESLRLAGIVENVLDYARLGTRKRTSPVEPETVANLLFAVAPDLLQRARQAGLKLEISDVSTGDDRVRIDPLALGRLLYNLVDNACKYASAGAERSIQLRATIDRNTARFAVSDHGPGIAPADERRLFRPFQRGSSLEHAATPGLGLGLSLSREIAGQAGGDVRLDRTSPGGTTFVLTLPLVRP